MYTREPPFFVSRINALAVGAFPVGTLEHVFTRSSRIPKGYAVPFGFWCGGFSSTADYVSGNEAQAFGLSDWCCFRG
jgi:hypothetical protein